MKLLHYFNQINIREYKKRVLDVIRLNSLEDRIWNLFRGFEIAAIIPNGNNVAIGLCKYYFIISEESIENKYEKLIDSQIYQLIADSNKPFDIFSNQIIDFELPEEANVLLELKLSFYMKYSIIKFIIADNIKWFNIR